MNYNYDHDRFVNKNRSLAKSYEVENHDQKLEERGFSRGKRAEEASCFNCKLRKKCVTFRSKQSTGVSGSVSVSGIELFMCDRYEPEPSQNKTMDKKQIKSLLKNIGKGGLK